MIMKCEICIVICHPSAWCLEGSGEEGRKRMAKILDAKKVKKLPVGTDVRVVRERTGETGMLWVVKSGRKKMLRGLMGMHEIKDRAGWHYELPEPSK